MSFSFGLNLFLLAYYLSLHYDPRIPGISEELTLATLEEFIMDAEQAVVVSAPRQTVLLLRPFLISPFSSGS